MIPSERKVPGTCIYLLFGCLSLQVAMQPTFVYWHAGYKYLYQVHDPEKYTTSTNNKKYIRKFMSMRWTRRTTIPAALTSRPGSDLYKKQKYSQKLPLLVVDEVTTSNVPPPYPLYKRVFVAKSSGIGSCFATQTCSRTQRLMIS